MDEEILKRLYESTKRHYDVPDFETFKMDLQDDEKLSRLRNSLSRHYDVPEFETFKADVQGDVKKKVTSEPVGDTEGTMASTTEQAPASPTSSGSQPSEISTEETISSLGEMMQGKKKQEVGSVEELVNNQNPVTEEKQQAEEFRRQQQAKKVTTAQKEAIDFAGNSEYNLSDEEQQEYTKLYNKLYNPKESKGSIAPIQQQEDTFDGFSGVNVNSLNELRKLAKENVIDYEYIEKAKKKDEELIEKNVYDDREQIRDVRYKMISENLLNPFDKKEYDLITQLKEDEKIIALYNDPKTNKYIPNLEEALNIATKRKKETEKNIAQYRETYLKENEKDIEKARLELANDPDNESLKENLLKAKTKYASFINPVEAAKKIYEDNPEIEKAKGDTPMEKFLNYFDAAVLQYEDAKKEMTSKNIALSAIPLIDEMSGASEDVRRYAKAYKKIEELAPIALLNRKALSEDNFFSQLGKSFSSGLTDGTLFTTEAEQSDIIFDALDKSKTLNNVSKEQVEALEASFNMNNYEKTASTLGSTLAIMPAFMGGGAAIKGLKNATKIGKAFDKVKDMNKATRLLLGATESGVAYEAASIFGDEAVADDASFVSGALGEVFSQGLSAVAKNNIVMSAMVKAFGKNASKAQRYMAITAQRSGQGFGEVAEEYGNEIGSIINESDGSLKKMQDLYLERFGTLDQNIEFGIMTFGMGVLFGSATKAGQGFADSHKDWLSKQSDAVKENFNKLSSEVSSDISKVAEELTAVDSKGVAKDVLGDDKDAVVFNTKGEEVVAEEAAPVAEEVADETRQKNISERSSSVKKQFGDQHATKALPYNKNKDGKGRAEIYDITKPDEKGVVTAQYANPETGSVDVIISGINDKNFVGYTRVYENGKPTNMFTAKMESTKDAFKNMITSAEATLPDNAEVVEETSISEGGLKVYNNSKLTEKLDEDGNVVTRPTPYSDATKESVKQDGQSAYKPFKTTDKAAAEAEVAKIEAAYPGINANIKERKGAPSPPPLPGQKAPKIPARKPQYSISIDLPVLIKSQETKTEAVAEQAAEQEVTKEELTKTTSLKTISEKYPDVTIDVFEDKKNKILNLGRIIVPEGSRGEGIGTRSMQDLVDYADENNLKFTLTPSKEFGATSVTRLKKFYKQFGFVENKGKNRDFSHKESMYRAPELKDAQEFIEEEAKRLENLIKKKDPQFQLDRGQTPEQQKEELEKKAVELFSSQDNQDVGDVAVEAETTDVTPTPVEITENKNLSDKVKKLRLKDIIGKKLNLLMADKLKVELKDPSKPYNEETNPYIKMGGNFFPLMEKMFGKVGWASIDDKAATRIIKGAMSGDQSVVYNMGDGGIYSNIIMAQEIDKKIPQAQKSKVWDLVKEQIQKSKNNKVNPAKKYLSQSNDILSFFTAVSDNTDVDTRAETLKAIVPESLDINAKNELFKMMQSFGISLEVLVDENSEQFVRDQPIGALTMVIEITNKDGVKVSDLKKDIDKKLANKQITKEEYKKAFNDIIESAKMNHQQQDAEGIPRHPNYKEYIRGRAVGIMEETVPFYRVIKGYFSNLEERALGVDKAKSGKVKDNATETESAIYDKIQEAKRTLKNTSLSSEEKKLKIKKIIKSIIRNDAGKLEGDVNKETISTLKEILNTGNQQTIKELLAKAETPFSKLKPYSSAYAKSAASQSAQMTGTTSYEITEKTASAYERFVNRLTKAFPNVEVSTSVDEFDSLIKDLKAKALSVKGQKIYGAVYNGKLYLNPAFENFNTPVHEFGHIWINTARQLNPELYRKGMDLVLDSSYESAVRNSKDYNRVIEQMEKDGATQEEINTYIQEEALATAIGDKGESFVNASAKRDFKNWLKDLLTNVKKLMGISKYTAEQIEDITLDEFVQAVSVDLLSGEQLFDQQVNAFTDSLQLMTAPNDSSINDIVTLGRQESIPDVAIRELLKRKGFKKVDIDEALRIEVDLFVDMPIEFERVADGASSALQLFKNVSSDISKFVKKNKDASITQIKEKGIEILKSNPIYKKQNRQVKQELISGFEKTISNKKANLSFQKKMSNLRRSLRDRKIGSNDLAQVQAEMKRFVINNLIVSNRYNKARVSKIIRSIADTNIDNIKAQSQKVLDIINRQRDIDKGYVIKDIHSILRKKSRKKDKTVGAEPKGFFKQADKVLKAVRDGNTEEISRELDENAAVIDEIQERYNNKEKLTKKESELYNKFLAFSMFENIGSMSLEQVQEINRNIKEYTSKAIERLNAIKTIKAERRRAIAEKVESQIKKTNPEMFNDGGVLLNKEEMNRNINKIYENFRRLKIPAAFRGFVENFKYGSLSSFKRGVLEPFSHLETLSNILDKTIDNLTLFRENIYDALNIMNTNYLDGKDKTLDKINNIAKGFGFKKGYKGVKIALHSKGIIEIPGIYRSETKGDIKNKFTADEALRVYALSLNENVKVKLFNQGFTEEKLETIKKHLGTDLVSFAEDIVSFLSNEYFEGINDVYSSTNNENLGYIENYFPLSTIFSEIKENDIKDSNFLYNFNAEQSPNLKGRTNRESDVAFSGFDFTGVLDKYIDGMERYKSHAQGIKDLNTFLNIPSVKALLKNLSMDKLLKERINSTINPMSAKEAAFANSNINKVFSKLTGFVLSFKFIQILKQATSFINAFEDYDYFGKDSKIPAVIRRRADFIMFMIDAAKVYASLGKDLIGKTGAIREAMEISPDFKQRFIQGLQGETYTLESGSEKFIPTNSKRFTKRGRAIAVAKATAGAPTSIGDALGVLGYLVNYKRNIANGMNKSDAVLAFNNYNATQQTRRGTERIALQTNNNYLVRAFTMFGSTQFLQINKVLSSSRNIFDSLTSGKLPRTKDVRSFYLNAAIANMMFVAASNIAKFAMGDEEDLEEVIDDMTKAMFGLNLLYQIPLFGQALEEFDLGGRIIAGIKDEEYKKKWVNVSVVNPYTIMSRKIIKSVNNEGNLLAAARPIAEAAMGTQLDPFVALYNLGIADDTEEFNEEMLKSIGISSYYMPKHLRQDERDKELAKFIREQEKANAKYYKDF